MGLGEHGCLGLPCSVQLLHATTLLFFSVEALLVAGIDREDLQHERRGKGGGGGKRSWEAKRGGVGRGRDELAT